MRVALWVGDSFTRGEGAFVPEAATYPYLIGASLGWRCRVDAQNGTGFLNDGRLAGPGLAPLAGRLPQTRRRLPVADVVVVDGGRNDALDPPAAVAAAADGYLRDVRVAYPAARLVVVLPTLLSPRQPPEYLAIGDVLRRVAPGHGAQVVDPSRAEGFAASDDRAELVCLDGFHPSAAGQRHYAEVLTPLLAGLDREGPATSGRT